MSRARRYAYLVVGATAAWLVLSCLALSLTEQDRPNPSYTQFGHDITVGPSDEVGDLTCFGCSIHVHGLVSGDVATFGGSITLEDQAQVAGDIAAFAGNVRLIRNAKVAGDTAVFGGQLQRDAEASVAGDVTAFSGRGWILLMFGAPLVILGLLVTGVVWLVQRLRRPTVVATA